MLLPEQLDSRVRSNGLGQNPEKLGGLPSWMEKKIKDLLMPDSRVAWMAPLPPNNFRLLSHYNVRNGRVTKVEIFESRRMPGPNHARIYLVPAITEIPTIVFGEYSAVAHSAWRDKRPAIPLSQMPQEITVGTLALKHPDDLVRFPGLADIIELQPKLMYAVRPSSFLLTEVSLLDLDGVIVKTKMFKNHFADHEVFWHLTSPDEWNQALPALGVNGITLTNSETYAQAHPELKFAVVTDDEDPATQPTETVL